MNGKAGLKGKASKPKLVVPPKLLMAIEKDKTLKDRLKRYNLPIKGSRQVDILQWNVPYHINVIQVLLHVPYSREEPIC